MYQDRKKISEYLNRILESFQQKKKEYEILIENNDGDGKKNRETFKVILLMALCFKP